MTKSHQEPESAASPEEERELPHVIEDRSGERTYPFAVVLAETLRRS